MANHFDSCSGSANLCRQLSAALKLKIPNLIYEQQKNKCKLTVPGARTAFAWVNAHNKNSSRINIWFLEAPDWSVKEKSFPFLRINPRSVTTGTWAKYPGSFMIENAQQVEDAAAFLASVSYPASLQ
ncbi:MAG: hypothetical protein ACLQU4_00505 [Limisphaerales bacterium]